MRFAELDAVTVDGYGTLLQLNDPTGALHEALARHGFDRSPDQVAAAFRAEVEHYKPRAHLGHDERSLAELRRECVAVFLAALDVELPEETFVSDFMTALVFELAPGAAGTLAMLRDHDLKLGVVANWDCSLSGQLERAGLPDCFDTVVTSARAGVAKPDPAIFRLALQELGVAAKRTLHVGDDPCDDAGARAAGLRFAPAPLASAFEGWA